MQDKMVFLQVAGALILAAAMGCLAGCGSGGIRHIAVADKGNNRVMIFNRPFSTNESAGVVLGQPDFNSGAANQGGTLAANTLSSPFGVSNGPHGDLIVADTFNCRVVAFKPPFSNNMNAFWVLGEPDFVTARCLGGTSATASSLFEPVSSVLDSHGNLWVADEGDSRVLMFPAPITNGEAATVVLGQTATDGASGTNGCNRGGTATPDVGTLCAPSSVFFDRNGNLWVTDAGNIRVLEFVPPFTTGMDASLAIGQVDFTSSTVGTSASIFEFPFSAISDSHGNLWVTDPGNNRVLEFVPPFSNGMSASLVLGQLDFVSSVAGTNARGFFDPLVLSFERNGNLVVSDSINSRVMIFVPPFSNGMSATSVLGQPDFTSGAGNQGNATPLANTLLNPIGLVTSP